MIIINSVVYYLSTEMYNSKFKKFGGSTMYDNDDFDSEELLKIDDTSEEEANNEKTINSMIVFESIKACDDDLIKLEDNFLIGNMHLMDGDIFVIKTEFDKEEMLFSNYSEDLENIFVYVHGEYKSKDWYEPDVLKRLKVDVLINKLGHWRSCGCEVYKKGVTWKDIKEDILDIFIGNTSPIEQFKYRVKTSFEYVGNCGKYKFLEDKHLKLIDKWLLNKDNEPLINSFMYYDRLAPICNLYIGDVYKSNNITFTIESWREDEREETQVYRALKNACINERDANLIANFLDMKLKAVKIKYKQRKEEGYLTENIEEGEELQPILLGFHISTMYDLFCGENYVADSVREHFGKIDVGKMEEVRK